jgi:hypothetical protein
VHPGFHPGLEFANAVGVTTQTNSLWYVILWPANPGSIVNGTCSGVTLLSARATFWYHVHYITPSSHTNQHQNRGLRDFYGLQHISMLFCLPSKMASRNSKKSSQSARQKIYSQ